MAPNLGTKRQCPKCSAKFYDLGALDIITCPKCKHAWKEGAAKKKPKKAKKVVPAPVKVAIKPVRKDDGLPDDLPEVEDGDEITELEPVEDDGVEIVSLDEVEEHEEKKDENANSDDAEDDMFTEIAGEEKLVDDLEQYIEKDEDEEDDGEEE